MGSGTKIGYAFGIKEQKSAYKNGISDEKTYLVTTLLMNGVNIRGRQILPPVPREVPPVQELSIVHGIAELQSLDKPTLITTCFQLTEHFRQSAIPDVQ